MSPQLMLHLDVICFWRYIGHWFSRQKTKRLKMGSRLERDLNMFLECLLANRLPLNIDKRAVISFSRSYAKVIHWCYSDESIFERVICQVPRSIVWRENFQLLLHHYAHTVQTSGHQINNHTLISLKESNINLFFI